MNIKDRVKSTIERMFEESFSKKLQFIEHVGWKFISQSGKVIIFNCPTGVPFIEAFKETHPCEYKEELNAYFDELHPY